MSLLEAQTQFIEHLLELNSHCPIQRVLADHIDHNSFIVGQKAAGQVQALLNRRCLITFSVRNIQGLADRSCLWTNA